MLIENYFTFFKNSLFVCLCLSTVFYWISLRLTHLKLVYIAGKTMSLMANISLFSFLLLRWFNYGYFPLSNLYESLLFLSCLLLFVQHVLEYKTQSRFFGTLLLPIILFITTFADLTLPLEMQKASALVPALQSNWLMMHVSLMMLSYAVLLLGSLFSIIFLLIDVSLPIKKVFNRPNIYFEIEQDSTEKVFDYKTLKVLEYFTGKSVNRMVSEFLTTLDNWSYRAISLGFPLLTIGIISGAVWANEAWGSYWSWDPKETWALITWLVFAAYLHVRLIAGWSGKGPAILASLGFFVVWICYLGVNFLGQGLHSYGWLS
uniref:Cytochrome c biogenesis protein n=1 Tax=Phaeostrophion irregulare TaxID=243268 RepID=UPI002E78A4A0|nr:Cytochrome c biogenesis protein [Phaeostrophion irregulare]WAM64307.1 Cytochrome c biogenesis protein [Phaeostrophion irregulare]